MASQGYLLLLVQAISKACRFSPTARFRKASADFGGHCRQRKENPDLGGILKCGQSFLTYRFGGGCVFFGPLAEQLPVPRPMA